MSMDLFIARSLITKASLVSKGPIDIRETQVLLSFCFQCNSFFILLLKYSLL